MSAPSVTPGQPVTQQPGPGDSPSGHHGFHDLLKMAKGLAVAGGMLATLIRPDGGDATIAGVDLRRDTAEVRRHIGFVAQGSGTYDRSTARRDLVHQARMYGSSKSAAKGLAEISRATNKWHLERVFIDVVRFIGWSQYF